jgi:hypothetical protein
MNPTTRLIPLAVLVTVLAACAINPSAYTQQTKVGEVSASFRACASESKIPWLVNVVLEDKGNKKSMKTLVSDFVGGSTTDQTRALSYLNDLQLRKYDSGEHMAATHFNTCLAQKSTQTFAPGRALSCFQEQSIIFKLVGLRFDKEATQEQATQHLIQATPSGDGSSERVVRRLARDVYTILTPGAESAFGQAQFDVCMTQP